MRHIQSCLVLGVDPSLTATGVVVLRVGVAHKLEVRRAKCEVRFAGVCKTEPSREMSVRLKAIYTYIYDVCREQLGAQTSACVDGDNEHQIWAVEDFARNARFAREEAGMVQGVCRLAVLDSGRDVPVDPVCVSPRTAKQVACPEWPGWSKKHWQRAGYQSRFKMSMPDKKSVLSGLRSRWGLFCPNDAVGDAVCVALVAAAGVLRLNTEVGK